MIMSQFCFLGVNLYTPFTWQSCKLAPSSKYHVFDWEKHQKWNFWVMFSLCATNILTNCVYKWSPTHLLPLQWILSYTPISTFTPLSFSVLEVVSSVAPYYLLPTCCKGYYRCTDILYSVNTLHWALSRWIQILGTVSAKRENTLDGTAVSDMETICSYQKLLCLSVHLSPGSSLSWSGLWQTQISVALGGLPLGGLPVYCVWSARHNTLEQKKLLAYFYKLN